MNLFQLEKLTCFSLVMASSTSLCSSSNHFSYLLLTDFLSLPKICLGKGLNKLIHPNIEITDKTQNNYFPRGIYSLARVYTFQKQGSLIVKYQALMSKKSPGVPEIVPPLGDFLYIFLHKALKQRKLPSGFS